MKNQTVFSFVLPDCDDGSGWPHSFAFVVADLFRDRQAFPWHAAAPR
jgi:hypothetical protein